MTTTNTNSYLRHEHSVDCNNQVLNVVQTIAMVGISKPTIYHLMAGGEFGTNLI